MLIGTSMVPVKPPDHSWDAHSVFPPVAYGYLVEILRELKGAMR